MAELNSDALKAAIDAYEAYPHEPGSTEETAKVIVRAYLAAMPKQQPSGWRPIESAPKGTMILVCSMKSTEARDWCFVDWLDANPFAEKAGIIRLVLHPSRTATNWQPLPEPPKGADG